jgi:hypothetical protein
VIYCNKLVLFPLEPVHLAIHSSQGISNVRDTEGFLLGVSANGDAVVENMEQVGAKDISRIFKDIFGDALDATSACETFLATFL